MEQKQFEIICQKLDKISIVLTLQNIEDKDKKIKILKKLGLGSEEIGDLIGVDSSTIRKSKGWKDGK